MELIMEYHDRFEQGVVIDERTTHEESLARRKPLSVGSNAVFFGR